MKSSSPKPLTLAGILAAALLLAGCAYQPARAVFQQYLGNVVTTAITNSGALSQTGAAAFSGSLTATGPAYISSAAVVNAGAGSTVNARGYTNFSVLMSSVDISVAVASITFNASDFGATDFSSGSWMVKVVLVSTNLVHYMAYFADDLGDPKGTVYKTNNIILAAGSAGVALTTKGCTLDGGYGGLRVAAGGHFAAEFTFETVHGSSNTILGSSNGWASSNETPTVPAHTLTDCYRTGGYTGLPTKIVISANTTGDTTAVPNTGGLLRGHAELWRVGARRP